MFSAYEDAALEHQSIANAMFSLKGPILLLAAVHWSNEHRDKATQVRRQIVTIIPSCVKSALRCHSSTCQVCSPKGSLLLRKV
jgi:hypothetical protein